MDALDGNLRSLNTGNKYDKKESEQTLNAEVDISYTVTMQIILI